MTNSPELTIRKNNKTKIATAKVQLPWTWDLAEILQVHGQHFTIVNFRFQHIPASPHPRITPALWTNQAGNWQPGCKGFSLTKIRIYFIRDKDKQLLKEVLWRGAQYVHLQVKNWGQSNKCLWEMHCAILLMPFPGEKWGKERSHYTYTGARTLTATENFAAVLLENMSQLRH